jgi:hypothetical protein
VWTHLEESEDRLTLKRECGGDPTLKRVYGPTLKTALRSQSRKELKLLAEAGAGMKFRLRLPAPGQTLEIYTYLKSNQIYLLITIQVGNKVNAVPSNKSLLKIGTGTFQISGKLPRLFQLKVVLTDKSCSQSQNK